jgi:Ser/Thr protein kinase RdoA (MazF antagonist)
MRNPHDDDVTRWRDRMAHFLPVVHSTLEVGALVDALWPEYHLARPTACHLIQCGFNDHYFISTPDGDYVLRLYSHGRRTAEDIAYELAVLAHLEARGVPVCAPIVRRDGACHCTIPALEGPRTAVLFSHASGHRPEAANLDETRACGRTMALIHRHSDGFTCEHQRFVLDLRHLIDRPIEVILPFLAHRPADAAFVRAVAGQLHAGLAAQVDELEWGYCHGDYPSGNIRMDADGSARVFDFDCSGLGWRAYDLAVCRLGFGETDAIWDAFCEGYREVRPLSEAALTAIPWFMVARQVWRTGLFAEAGSRVAGSFYVNDGFFDRNLGVLRDRISEHLPQLAVD